MFNFVLHLHPYDYISDAIRVNKCWEPRSTEVFIQMLRTMRQDTHVFIDIGANIGYYTMIVASSGKMQVIAYEPVGRNLNLLRNSVADNKLEDRVIVMPYSLGGSEKIVKFYVERQNAPTPNFGTGSARETARNHLTEEEWVQQRVMQNCLNEIALTKRIEVQNKKAILKIDAEEQELEIMQSFSQNFWDALDALMVEVYSPNLEVIFKLLKDNHFSAGVLILQGLTSQDNSVNPDANPLSTFHVKPIDTLKQDALKLNCQMDVFVFKQPYLNSVLAQTSSLAPFHETAYSQVDRQAAVTQLAFDA